MLSTVESSDVSWNDAQRDGRLGIERPECIWKLLRGHYARYCLHMRNHNGLSRSAEDGGLSGETFKSMADWVVGV